MAIETAGEDCWGAAAAAGRVSARALATPSGQTQYAANRTRTDQAALFFLSLVFIIIFVAHNRLAVPATREPAETFAGAEAL
jgi:hypothetical protein